MSVLIGSGHTPAGATNWQPYPDGNGIFVDVDTSAAQFPSTPAYSTALACDTSAWATTGANVIYWPKPTGFRVYVRLDNGGLITVAQANAWKWHIHWTGFLQFG